MNDGGHPGAADLEIHLRKALTLKRKPVWHAIWGGRGRGGKRLGQKVKIPRPFPALAQHYYKQGCYFFPENLSFFLVSV